MRRRHECRKPRDEIQRLEHDAALVVALGRRSLHATSADARSD
jgi:hypothetical protein